MINKILSILLIFLLTGCVNKESAEKALQDTITFSLVKESIGDDMYQPPYGVDTYVHNYYNSCSTFSRLKTSLALFLYPMSSGTYRKISCDALELRLKNKLIKISASDLVDYYMDKLAAEQLKADQELIKQQQAQQKKQIEDMAMGKN